jgi:hypothetical protein
VSTPRRASRLSPGLGLGLGGRRLLISIPLPWPALPPSRCPKPGPAARLAPPPLWEPSELGRHSPDGCFWANARPERKPVSAVHTSPFGSTRKHVLMERGLLLEPMAVNRAVFTYQLCALGLFFFFKPLWSYLCNVKILSSLQNFCVG